jgi:serine/threonine-protein kinase OSR1/STK39
MTARRLFSDATFKFIGAVEDEWQLYRSVHPLGLFSVIRIPMCYSDNGSDYTLGGPIGFGASSIVYQAEYHPSSGGGSIPCALKVLDLDSLPMHSLRLLRKETQLMSLSKHPNVLRVRGTWIDGSKLYIALRLMRSGSVADVMHYGWPGGVDEEVAKCILKQALDGLKSVHIML